MSAAKCLRWSEINGDDEGVTVSSSLFDVEYLDEVGSAKAYSIRHE